jgi:hypothetical protein
MWGAARHDIATGVHRPLYGDVLVLGALDGQSPLLVRVQLDMVGLSAGDHNALVAALSDDVGVPRDRVIVTYSHTHSGGYFAPDRVPFAGGALIGPHLQETSRQLRAACAAARAALQPVSVEYAIGRCTMAANRDYWDDANSLFACGYNPDAPADDVVVTGRITDATGRLLATLVHYACHPTTLAWENTLISPDYVGAARDVVEQATGAPCIFLLGACGDLGPSDGQVGDAAVADKNGRQLGYAAMSAFAGLGPAATDEKYGGPVISGATLGSWTHVALSELRLGQTARFTGGSHTLDLPLKARPDPVALQRELDAWEDSALTAQSRGDTLTARDSRARAERARRWIGRIAFLPEGTMYPYRYSVHRMGDAVWVTCGGEPYNVLQVELRRRFPNDVILVSPLASDLAVAYLLPVDRYGKGLYQEEPSILAPGCLERLIEAVATSIVQVSPPSGRAV